MPIPLNQRIRSPYGGSIPDKLSFYSREGINGCIEWAAAKDDSGYGIIMYQGKVRKAHRLALQHKLGRPIIDGLYVLHSCHNPGCINPDHLREGTQMDNMKDMTDAGRGRSVKGEANHMAKWTDAQIEAIRNDKRQPRFIIAEYGISKTHLRRVQDGRRGG